MRRSTVRTFTALGAALVLGPASMLAGGPTGASGAPGAQPHGPAPTDARADERGQEGDRGSWQVRRVGDQQVLRWRSPSPLPITGARPEFRLGGAVLGFPQVSAVGRTLSLIVEAADPAATQVWLSGRRLDVHASTGPSSSRGPQAAPPLGPTVVPVDDPGEPGPLAFRTFDYAAEDLPWREFDGALEVLGHVVLPQGVTDAPLVLFLHGRHQACYGGNTDGSWPCSGGSKPVPSHLGYDYLQRLLASQGYATVSIAANGINQQDWISPDGGASARSALVRHHLKLLAQWSADATKPRWHQTLDTRQTVLVGHSRGGEGVNQAAIETLPGAPYRLLGQTLIAPTDFGYQTAGYLPTVTLLPYCDGDVYDLQGQRYVDAAATLGENDPSLRSSVLMRGANHNFFNTEWTPGISQAPSNDDWGDKQHPVCGTKASPTRLSAAEQRRAARTFVGASVAAFITGDQGAVDIVDSATPVRIPAAGGAVAWTHASGGNRTRVAVRDGAIASGSGFACRAVARAGGGPTERAAPPCGPTRHYSRPLHWAQAPGRYASVQTASLAGGAFLHLRLIWDRAGAQDAGGLDFDSPLDLSGVGTALDLRVVADPAAPSARFTVRLTDGDGTSWQSPVQQVAPRPGGPDLTALHAQTVRIEPAGVPAELDLAAISAAELVPVSDSGSLWVLDAAARRTGLAPVPDIILPSISLGRALVPEGDSPSTRVAEVPFRVHGDVLGSASFGVAIDQLSFGDQARSIRRVVSLSPGQTDGVIKVPFHADRLRGMSRLYQAIYGAGLDDVTMRSYFGRLMIREDDPAPRITVRAARDQVRYGAPIRIVVQLSAPMSVPTYIDMSAVRVPGTRALRTDDVPRRWLEQQVGEFELGRPLAAYLKYTGVFLDVGQARGVLEIPTRELPDPQGIRTLGIRQRDRDAPPVVAVTVR